MRIFVPFIAVIGGNRGANLQNITVNRKEIDFS